MNLVGVNSFTVGKTNVIVRVHGCVDCGAREAEYAVEAQYLMFQMGDRKYRIQLKRCPDCDQKRYGTAAPVRDDHHHSGQQFMPLRGGAH